MKIVRKDAAEFLDDRFLQRVVKEKRGVGDVPADARGVEEAAEHVGDRVRRASTPRSITAASRSGSSAHFSRARRRSRTSSRMTAAGQSALNVQGLDTVVIDDTRFCNVIERGKNVLTQAAPRRERDSADGGARARARRGRARVHPLRSRHPVRGAAGRRRPNSSSPAIRSASR